MIARCERAAAEILQAELVDAHCTSIFFLISAALIRRDAAAYSPGLDRLQHTAYGCAILVTLRAFTNDGRAIRLAAWQRISPGNRDGSSICARHYDGP